MRRVQAFTLIEVAFSILILAVAVLTTMAFALQGGRTLQNTRYKMLAATKAMDVVDAYNTVPLTLYSVRGEARDPLGVTINRCVTAPDLEQHAVTSSTGVYPLPTALARRFDSENSEIRQLLDDGGVLYYFGPLPASVGLDPSLLTKAEDAVMQKAERALVFGVRGYAQQNSLNFHPNIAWPYYNSFPNWPMIDNVRGFFRTRTDKDPPGDNTTVPDYPTGSPIDEGLSPKEDKASGALAVDISGWECPMAPALTFDLQVFVNLFPPAQTNAVTGNPIQLDVERYLRSMTSRLVAQRYVRRSVGLGDAAVARASAVKLLETLFGVAPGTYASNKNALKCDPTNGAHRWPDPTDAYSVKLLPAKVMAWSYVALCSALLTSQRPSPSASYTVTTVNTPAPTVNTLAQDTASMQEDTALALEWIMAFQANNPYDFRVYRPHQRHLCMDFPLFQADIFSPVTDLVGNSYPGGWTSWATVYPAEYSIPAAALGFTPPIGQFGQYCSVRLPQRSMEGLWSQWDLVTAPPVTWQGNLSHFNLTQPFEGADRCRQIVFWAVDWQSYKDAESQPSEPFDSSRQTAIPARQAWVTAAGGPFRNVEYVASPSSAGSSVFFNQQARFGNPETPYCFKDETRSSIGASSTENNPPSQNQSLLGYYGVDRNGNGIYDEGAIPPSVRMRAITVGRYNFYDRRLPGTIR